jgi:cytochrome c peroxidase
MNTHTTSTLSEHFRYRAVAAVFAGALLISSTVPADERATERPKFTAGEIDAIVSHGPWPAPSRRDPSNRVSGNAEAVEFGTHLFFDARLSGKGNVSCGSCHVPERNWTDNMHRGIGNAEMDRNTPTLMNVRLGRWFGWDGAADSLWAQSIRPILEPRELGSSAHHVAELVRKDDQLACRYRKTFGAGPSSSDDEKVLVDVAKALAAFQETLHSGRTPFDAFRDRLSRGEPYSDWHYSPAAQRGLKIFIGKGACNTCHTGPNFTGDTFHATGIASKMRDGNADRGRVEGISKVRESRFNLLGPYNDDATRTSAVHTRQATATGASEGAFKVPTLRNTMLTAPYGHHGEVASLAEMVRHYSEVGHGHADAARSGKLTPLKLTAAEQSDLVVFLESLNTFSNPWRPEDSGRCQ